MGELTGLHILVTRPQAQAELWAQRLRALGARVNVVPLLEIVPVSDDAQVQAVKNRILNFDLYRKAIFVSQNAVEHGVDWLENYWPQIPYGIDFFAVGETTSKQLQARGVQVTDLVQSQTGAMTSETLLQSPALQSVEGEKILIFRGVGGRPHMGDVLSERGALVDYCELYERILPAESSSAFAHCLSSADSNLVVTLHSGEALENLQKIVRQMTVAPAQVMLNMQLLVPSQRILTQAHAAGFARVHAAQNATESSMLQGLVELQRKYVFEYSAQR